MLIFAGFLQTDKIIFQITSNKLYFDTRTIYRGNGYYEIKGYPIYPMRVQYALASAPSVTIEKTVFVAFNHLKNWNMYLYNSMVTVNNTGTNVIGNSTFDCGQVSDANSTAITFTGVQTCYESYVDITDNGVGYTYDIPTVTVSGGTWGRYTSSRTKFGKCAAGRIDEINISVPSSTRLAINITNMARAVRFIYTISNSFWYYNKSSKLFERPWFGTDNQYENQGFGAQTYLTDNKIVGVESENATQSDELFVGGCPGYVYNSDYWHVDKNENGYKYPYTRDGHNIDEQLVTNYEDYLNDKINYNLVNAVYDVIITDGKVSGFSPISRPDGDGTYITGGCNYFSPDHDNRELYLVRYNTVSVPSGYVEPKAYYVTNGTADNGKGKKVTASTSHPDFFSGFNIPDGAYLYAIAGQGYHKAPTIKNKFCLFLVRSVIDWGLGDYPNYLVILWFCSILN